MNKFMARLTQVSFWGPETLRGNGASARAKHQQATAEKVSAVTTERINMLKTLKRKIALGAVAAVGAAGLVTIAAPAANAVANLTAFSLAVQPQRAITGITGNVSITAAITATGSDTGTIMGTVTSAPTPATADSTTAVAAGDTLSATITDIGCLLSSCAGDPTVFTTSRGGVAGASTVNGPAFNASGSYTVTWWFDKTRNNLIDANEPFIVSSFSIGGAPTSLSLASSALTVAGTSNKTFSVILKDSTGAGTKLKSGTNERITYLASVPATTTETMTVTGGAAAANVVTTALGFPNVSLNSVAGTILPGDTSTASTGGYSLAASLSGAAVGTIVFNLGGSLIPTTAVSGTLTASAVSLATSIALANTAGVTAASAAVKGSVAAAAHAGKNVAPLAMDTGSAAGVLYAVFANSTAASTLTFNLVGTAGGIVNVALSGDNVTAATTPITLDATGKGTYTVTPTTAAGVVNVSTSMKNAAGTTFATGYAVTYQASTVSGNGTTTGVAGTLGTNGITATPDLSTVTSTIVKTGAVTTVKVAVKDQYAVAKQFFAVSGSLTATSRNAAATITQQFTDANGEATITLTDVSTSTTNLSDVLSIQVTAPGSATSLLTNGVNSNQLTITYSSTGAYASLAITGGTSSTTTVSKAVIQLADATNHAVTLVPALKDAAGAAVSGVSLTYTGSDGVKFRTLANVATRTTGGDLGTITASSTTSVIAYGTKPGTATVTVAGGGLTATGTFTVSALANADTARSVALVAAGNKFTATVTDGWGNPVSGVTVSLATTSQGIFGGGVTSTSAVTDATGSATAVVSSADGKAGAVTVSATMTGGQSAAVAATPVADFAAAVASATATGAVVASGAVSGDAASATAQKATDAKIADIATAVTNLSTTVAGLVASLVAQIKDTKAAITATQTALTALAAVVNKIKAKVKA